ncbi:MAG: hypothetical protein DCC67_07985, partial [Planctomycetota bacterium]
MTSEGFIDDLERRRLISATVARQLRAKAQGERRIDAAGILKYLVQKGIVSRESATDILKTALVVGDDAKASILGEPAAGRDDPPPGKRLQSALDPLAPVEGRGADAIDADDLFAPAQGTSSAKATSNLIDEEIVDTYRVGKGRDVADAAPQRKGKKFKQRKKSRHAAREKGKSEWDSPLVLVGGAGLALLVVAGVVLYYLLTRENADLVLKEANQQFKSGAYTQAIGGYERFVQTWPSHEDASQARVRLGMAKIRRDVEGGTDYAGALATTQAVIEQIEDEPAFTSDGADDRGLSEAKRDLSELLTRIAEGLSQQADAATDSQIINQRVEQIETVLALTANTKYVPELLRQGERLGAVRETLERVLQRQERADDLAAALAAMDQAIAGGDPAAAFAARAALIDKHPVLIDDQQLAEKVRAIAQAEQTLIKFVAEAKPAMTEAPATPVVAEIALAERREAAAAAASSGGAPLVVKADGALYAFHPGDGALLWRRFVGLDNSRSYPLALADGNVVGADAARGELACLDSQTGKLIWRQPLEGQLATPLLGGDKLFVASDAGKLYVVEAANGALAGYVEFTQPLRLTPAINDAGDRLYVVGEHSNVYTLSTRGFACLGVFYAGHSAGSVTAPPLQLLNKLVIADNSGAETCQVRVLSLDAQGAVAKEVASHRLVGLVTTPLPKAARRFAAVTTRGQAVVFEAGASDDASALTALATREPENREQSAHFSLLHEGALWVASQQLAQLAVSPSGGQLVARGLDRDYRGDAFDYPLQVAGSVLLHVRRPAARPGVVVGATDAATNRNLWETGVAVPPAGAPAVDAQALQITVGASSGAVFSVDREAMTRRIQDRAHRIELPGDLPLMTHSLDLGQGRLAVGGVGATQLLLFRPEDVQQPLTAITLPSPLSCPPVAWGDGLVAATDIGQVFLYDATSGLQRGAPFQPEIVPGERYRWLKPAVYGAGPEARLV